MKNSQFGSDFIVLVAVAIYCTLVAFIMGISAASNSCVDHWTGCLGLWIQQYQTIIASFAVVFTIVVAKQQLDATNKQTRNALLASFWEKLESIELIRDSLNNRLPLPTYKKEFVRNVAPTKLFLAYSAVSSNIVNITDQQKDDLIKLADEEKKKIESVIY